MEESSTQLNSHLRLFDSKNGRYFNFNEFEVLGHKFIIAFALGFIRYSSSVGLDMAQDAYGWAVRFLRWLINNKEDLVRLTSSLQSDHTKASAKDWEDAVALWRDDLLGKTEPGPIRKYKLISGLNTLLKRMAGFGVIPKLTFIYAPPKLRKAVRPIRSLAELHHQKGEEDIKADLDKFLSGTAKFNINDQIKRDFLTTLLMETGRIAGTDEEHAKALMEINANRLEAVRTCASKDFRKWRDHFLEGQRLLQLCDMSFKEIVDIIDHHGQDTLRRSKDFATLFPENCPDLSLARLLKYFAEHPRYRGQVMRLKGNTIGAWFHRQSKRFGGIESLQAYVFPHPELITAGIVIILCDTGANVSVVRTLPRSCMEDSKERGYKVVKGNKMRATGKIIVNELPINDPVHDLSCVKVIETCQVISESLRKLATGKTTALLFLRIGWSGSVKGVSNGQWGTWFRSFRDRHEELCNLPIQSKMIRPSILLQLAYDKEAGIIAATLTGDHNSMVITRSYVDRYPNQVVWERMIREFQSLFQAVAIQNIEDAAEKLGLSRKQVEQLFSEACRTGLGVFCLNPNAGIQPGSQEGKTCTQIENCHSCPNMFVVATPENIRDLILWNYHLEQSRPEWELARPKRWEKVWLPWLVFTQVIIEKVSRGRTIQEFKKARALADKLLAKGEVSLPPLW